MRKVVINRCYGGFGLSLKGIEYYAQLNGDGRLFHYKLNYDDHKYYKRSEQHEYSSFYYLTVTKDLGEGIPESDFYGQYEKFHYNREIKRHDNNLVKTVEDLGEEANGPVSELKIVEIPDDVEYEIKDYDGVEWVAEKHRTWS